MRWELRVGLALGLLAMLLLATPVRAVLACGLLGRCVYEGVTFRFTVVDAESGKPLAEVHALAEWVLEGFHGVNGPLMVQDAVSGPDGVLAFPAWGPLEGPRSGLVIRLDPAITLFKPGYRVLPIFNEYMVHSVEHTMTLRMRRFAQDGQTFRLEPFRGTPGEWVEQLKRAEGLAYTGRAAEEQIRPFYGPLLNRKRRVLAERDRLSRDRKEFANYFWTVEDDIRFMEGRRK